MHCVLRLNTHTCSPSVWKSLTFAYSSGPVPWRWIAPRHSPDKENLYTADGSATYRKSFSDESGLFHWAVMNRRWEEQPVSRLPLLTGGCFRLPFPFLSGESGIFPAFFLSPDDIRPMSESTVRIMLFLISFSCHIPLNLYLSKGKENMSEKQWQGAARISEKFVSCLIIRFFRYFSQKKSEICGAFSRKGRIEIS